MYDSTTVYYWQRAGYNAQYQMILCTLFVFGFVFVFVSIYNTRSLGGPPGPDF